MTDGRPLISSPLRPLILLISVSLLVACGGGSSGDDGMTVDGDNSGTTAPVETNTPMDSIASWDGADWADYRPFIGTMTPQVRERLRAIAAVGKAMGRESGRMGQIGDSITESSAYFRNAVLNGIQSNETGHDYDPIRSWLAYAATQPADANSFYRDRGKDTVYGNKSGWTLTNAISAGHPALAVEVGDGVMAGQFAWVLIMFGTNDIDAGSWNADNWKSEYRNFVQQFIDLGIVPVLSTIPPEQVHVGDGRVELANQKIVEISEELEILMVDFNALILHYQPVNWNGSLISADGTHPSAGGGGREFSQTALTATDGYAARTKLSFDVAEFLRSEIFEPTP